ncbi:NAD binding Rossmann fold oxidoreductase, partial [Aspergillus filifer]
MKQPTFLIIGAGSRGTAYARAITTSTNGRIAAVAEPHEYKRKLLGETYIWGANKQSSEGQEFTSWQEWLRYEKGRRKVLFDLEIKARARGEKLDPETEREGGVDGIIVCTLDETHIEILMNIANAGFADLHVLCEKPLALSLFDCLCVYASWTRRPDGSVLPINAGSPKEETGSKIRQPVSIFSIGHVLRYSPHNLTLRKLVREEKIIGDIVSIEHTEPVGHWHFAHSYVRGNWRRETDAGDGSLLTKSCHDVDFLMWMVECPVYNNDNASSGAEGDDVGRDERKLALRSISSTGHLTQFTPSRKPKAAGTTTNCISCPSEVERNCMYSAIRIYRDDQLRKGETGWPVNIVCPDIEDYLDTPTNGNNTIANSNGEYPISKKAEDHLLSSLSQDYTPQTPDEEIKKRPWYGRCVYESDNNVIDDQVVLLAWDDITPSHSTSTNTNSKKKNKPGVTATLHMTAPTQAQCVRRGRIYGTTGEITYTSSTITIHSFATGTTRIIEIPKQPPEEEKAHGGGDYGLARGFVSAV